MLTLWMLLPLLLNMKHHMPYDSPRLDTLQHRQKQIQMLLLQYQCSCSCSAYCVHP